MVTDRTVLSRRSLLAGLAASVAVPAVARPPATSRFPVARPVIADLAQDAPVARAAGSLSDLLAGSGLSGQTALVALDAGTGEVIEAYNADLGLPPASTIKAITALYALQHLGPNFRHVTRVLSPGGAIEAGTLRGDLVLKGGGDPVLQTADLARMANELIERGLRRVEGRFVIDQNALPVIDQIDPSQPVQAGYNPSVSGLNLNFNRVYFSWAVSGGRATVSMDARSEQEIPPVSVIDMRAVARDLPVYTHDVRGNRERWTVAASALQRSGSRWLPVRHSGLYTGDVLRALLLARGCRVPEPQLTDATTRGAVLAEHFSDPLQSIVRDMLRYSTNLTAEAVALSATIAQGHEVRALAPSAGRMAAWVQDAHGGQGFELLDHSGLGDGSRVSALSMARFMLSARRGGQLPDLLRDHPMRDTEGRPRRDHPVTAKAKTGTLNFVSTLTGYAQLPQGRPVVFSIMCADLPRRRIAQEAGRERPPGARGWNRRARALQQQLIERWTLAQG